MAKYFVVLEVNDQDEDGRVVGVYQAPTLFCSEQHGGRKTQTGFTKGRKHGWWVCAMCKKPTKAWGASHQAVIGAGRNLFDGT